MKNGRYTSSFSITDLYKHKVPYLERVAQCARILWVLNTNCFNGLLRCSTSLAVMYPMSIKDYGQLVPKTSRIQDNSYPRHLVPKTTRTQDISYPWQLVPKTTRTQDNSYPGQLVPSQGDSYPRQLIPKTTRTQTQGNSCSKRLEPKTNRSQDKSLPKQLVFFRLVQNI